MSVACCTLALHYYYPHRESVCSFPLPWERNGGYSSQHTDMTKWMRMNSHSNFGRFLSVNVETANVKQQTALERGHGGQAWGWLGDGVWGCRGWSGIHTLPSPPLDQTATV